MAANFTMIHTRQNRASAMQGNNTRRTVIHTVCRCNTYKTNPARIMRRLYCAVVLAKRAGSAAASLATFSAMLEPGSDEQSRENL